MIMNNENEDVGESSKDPGRVEDNKQRPFKKARFEWELKGKHHLKEERNNVNNNETIETNDSESNKENHLNKFSENVPNDTACRKPFEVNCQHSIHLNDHFDEIDNTPVSLVPAALKEDDDFYLLIWQSRQIAKSVMDNTINRVLDTFNLNIEAFDSNEESEDDGQVEDEGILMAIQHHGLHSNNNTSAEDNNNSSSTDKLQPDFPESTLDNFENFHNELLKNNPSNESVVCDEIKTDSAENTASFDFMGAAVAAAIKKKGLTYE